MSKVMKGKERILSVVVGYAFIAALVVLLSGVFLSCSGRYARGETKTALRVMSYNIFWGKYGLEDLLETIREIDPDVLLIQEIERGTPRAGGKDQFAFFKDRLGWEGHFAEEQPHSSGKGVQGLGVFSKLPLRDVDHRALEKVPGHKDRAVLRVRVNWNGKMISFYTTHLVAWGHGRGTAARDRGRQATQLREFMEEDPYPQVLAGDMNCTRFSKAYRIFSRGLQDAWRVAGRGWWGATAYSFLPARRIDYIFVDLSLEVIRCFVVRSLASDHYPVVADLLYLNSF